MRGQEKWSTSRSLRVVKANEALFEAFKSTRKMHRSGEAFIHSPFALFGSPSGTLVPQSTALGSSNIHGTALQPSHAAPNNPLLDSPLSAIAPHLTSTLARQTLEENVGPPQ